MRDREKEIKYEMYLISEEIRHKKRELCVLKEELLRVREEKTRKRVLKNGKK